MKILRSFCQGKKQNLKNQKTKHSRVKPGTKIFKFALSHHGVCVCVCVCVCVRECAHAHTGQHFECNDNTIFGVQGRRNSHTVTEMVTKARAGTE